MAIKTIDEKDPAEIIPVTFDFNRELPSVDQVTITITIVHGIDANVSTMIFGSYQVVGKVVTQLIRYGVDNVTYLIRADAVSGNLKFSKACYMTVKTLS